MRKLINFKKMFFEIIWKIWVIVVMDLSITNLMIILFLKYVLIFGNIDMLFLDKFKGRSKN